MTFKKFNKSSVTFIKKYTQFLREDSSYSTMRMLSTSMIFTGCFYILFQTILKLPIDWFGVAGWATVALGGKMFQKKDEIKESINEQPYQSYQPNQSHQLHQQQSYQPNQSHQSHQQQYDSPPHNMVDQSMDPA